jgi:hypothetical protein
MIKNLLGKVSKCLIERVSITSMLDEEIDMLRRERIRELSRVVRAQAEVDYHDKLIAELSIERQAAEWLEFPPITPEVPKVAV